MKKLSLLGFVSLALFLGLSLVAYADDSAVAAGSDIVLEGDEGTPTLDANEISAQGVYDLTLRNGFDTGNYSYIYRGYSFVVWAWFSPSITGYPLKINTQAKIKGPVFNTLWNHLNTKTLSVSGLIGSASALACEPWASYNQRVAVKVTRPGFYSRTEYYYVR